MLGGTVLGLIGLAIWWSSPAEAPGVLQQGTPIVDASYVGSGICASCHAMQSEQWRTSQHHAAMSVASDSTVLGDFRDASFTYAGIKTQFFRRDQKFFVHTDGPKGQVADFEVRYTFGVYPLQQYLVEFEDGRLQPLATAWDARPKRDGGQRWFHLYPNEKINFADELHWTRPSQNWNFMCADCHSTAVRKNYDEATDRFQTQFAEVSVGCEACHGPASRHLDWAKAKDPRKTNKGLTIQFNERRGVAWTHVSNGQPTRSRPRTTDREIQVCAQCHSRRSQIADGYEPGKSLFDYYLPALLTNSLYHADGQQRGEVYNWGSFVQSKMYTKGVTCADCHNPHSGKLRTARSANATCTSCHLPRYDSPSHHRHAPQSAGASCMSCHMPTTTYMAIDPRHDHSFRIPRPDLTVTLGTPNACTNCHTNRDASWAATRVNEWFGPRPATNTVRYATAFSASNARRADAGAWLRQIAGDSTQPPIVRATAIAELPTSDDRDGLVALGERLRDPSPLVRLGALESAGQLPMKTRAAVVPPLLYDSIRAVRINAAALLAGAGADLRVEQRTAFERAAADFVQTQRYNADRADALVNLGTFYAERGDVPKAEKELQRAVQVDPFYTPAYINLADVLRADGRDADGERVLRSGIDAHAANATLHYSLGLTLVRLKRISDAVMELRQATTMEPDNPRFAYAHAMALQTVGKLDDAIASLERFSAKYPSDVEILAALARFHEARGNVAAARKYAERRDAAANRARRQR